jgi:putative phosphoribosyl transferase
MFHDREDAGRQLADQLKDRRLRSPLVLGIPRGGVPVGAALADALNAELDVVLSRKLRAPMQPELAIGAVSEGGEVYLDPSARRTLDIDQDYLQHEQEHQLAEISRQARLIRQVRPQAKVLGRSVIVTDDGIATGSTMIAALQLLRTQSPRELIVAVPVASPSRLAKVRTWCDRVVCLHAPVDFRAIGEFYDDFRQIEDEEVVILVRERFKQQRSNNHHAGSAA